MNVLVNGEPVDGGGGPHGEVLLADVASITIRGDADPHRNQFTVVTAN